MTRQLLLVLDKTVFRALFYALVLVAKLSPARAEVPARLRTPTPRFLVIRPGGLGDALMSLPFLRALKQTFPEGHVTVVCVHKNHAVFRGVSLYDELIVLTDLWQLPRNVLQLRRRKFDVVFDLEPFRRTSSIVGWLTGAPVRVGFDTNSRRRLCTHLVTYAGDSRFEAANMLHQLRAIDVDPPYHEAVDMSFALPGQVRAEARNLLAASGVDPRANFLVAVAVGAMKPHHRWVMSEFAALIRMIRSDNEATRILLVGSDNDRQDTDEVLRLLGGTESVVDLVGKTNTSVALGVLECCRIAVACDGGLVYMAAAMGCSTISLWGPGVMERFKPPGEQHIGVRKNYACVPCVTWDRLGEFPPCPYGRRCYNDMQASEVFAAYLVAKSRVSPQAAAAGLRLG